MDLEELGRDKVHCMKSQRINKQLIKLLFKNLLLIVENQHYKICV